MGSFSDSLQTLTTTHVNSNAAVASAVSYESNVATLSESESIAAYSEESYEKVENSLYLWIDDYEDSNYSYVDNKKNVTVNSEQINLTQEENSQVIPVELNRYYDGIDLSQMTFQIYYVNADGQEGLATPINVVRNSSKIRFYWLIDGSVTAIAGKIQFEIRAEGTISYTNNSGIISSKSYKWKTKPCEDINILKSLKGNGVIEPSEGWDTYLQQVSNLVSEASDSATTARQAAVDAQNAVEEIDTKIDNASTTIANQTYEKVITDMETELLKYYTREEVDALLENIDISDQLADIQDQINSLDGLANFNVEYDGTVMTFYNGETVMQEIAINNAPSTEWVTAYDAKVEEKISEALIPVTEDLTSIHENIDSLPETLKTDYYTKEETYNKEEIDTALDNIQVDLTGYATETFVNTKDAELKTDIQKNAGDIQTINATITTINQTLDSIDKSPNAQYVTTYNEAYEVDGVQYTGENTLVVYEVYYKDTENETRTIVSAHVITGGSGGSSSSNTIIIERITSSPFVVTEDDDVIIEYSFTATDSSGDDVGQCNASWKLGNKVIKTEKVYTGENSVDLTEFIGVGSDQKITLTISDDIGTIQQKTWYVSVVDVKLESTFDDTRTYEAGSAVSLTYTPYGAVDKTVHVLMDGEEIDTVASAKAAAGLSASYTVPAQSHGTHLLEIYMTAEINNNTVESNHITKDIMWYDSSTPLISTVFQDFTARQYEATNITYTVVDPATETPTVVLKASYINEDGGTVETYNSTLTLTSNTDVWSYKTDVIGEHILTITCGEIVKTLKATITELGINVSPTTAGLEFDFNPVGYSNNDANRIWSDSNTGIAMTVSDNFDWVNGGYQMDDAGDQYFCIKAGTTATINYNLFADDAKANGKEFKVIFKTTNVQASDAQFLTCVDNTTETDHVGIVMNVHEAYIYAGAGNLYLPYSEEDIIEFEFNINTNSETIARISGYEDGVPSRHLVYDGSHNFTQNTPQYITFGSEHCDVHIYRVKAYSASLTSSDILNNFIADARSAEEMIARHTRNQIYKEGILDPEYLAEVRPELKVYILSAPYFTNNKSDKVPGTTIQQIYKNGDPILDNWVCYDCMHSGQGTSSNNYGGAGRNLDFIMNKSGIDGVEPYFIFGDNSRGTEITLSRTSVPVAYLNAKVNIASANNFTNAMLANRYNKYNPYKRPFVRDEGVDTSFIKDTMEFYNCVIFIQETNEDLSTHREFADTNVHFYAIGNIGDSKKSDFSRLTDQNDPYECCIELMDVELPLSDFPQDTMMNAMSYKVDEETGAYIYDWATDDNLGILYELIDGEYVLTTDTTVDLTKTYYVDILEHDDFSEDYTYGWRYISDDENEEIVQRCKNAWIEAYRFVTNTTDEEFKSRFEEYFVRDSILYYYLFTLRYCMADNRSKNLFFHFGKTGTYRALTNPTAKLLHLYCELVDGKYVATTDTEINPSKTYYTQHAFDLSFGYDMDTSMGLNNYGLLAYRYGLEDIDYDENGEEVFREMDSTFFNRIRRLFPSELKSLYNTLESQNAWHAESFLNEIEAWQSQFSEELWRLDIDRKYIRSYTSTFINGKGDSQFLKNMANGKMKYPVKQWERGQEKYMASKFQSSVASSDNIVLRCTAPTGDLVIEPNYRLKLTPYDYMYLNVKYGTTAPIQLRAEPNVEYEIPFEGSSADIVDVYSASCIRSLGDLSPCYPATVDTSKGSRLKELIIGNSTEGYDNPSFTTLTLGANTLLETLNLENISGLTQSLEVSALNNLKELYAHGTNSAGVTFADGGLIEIAELPAINAMSMKNLAYLTTLDVVSFENLIKLVVENCSTIDLLDILNAAPNLNRVRIVGIDWSLENTDLLTRLYNMYGVDSNGFNIAQSVLSGKVFVPVVRQQELRGFNEAWQDLEITYNTLVEQFPVAFVNEDGTVLDIQYVDIGQNAVDPITREENPIATPTKESTVSHNFTFAGWDIGFEGIFAPRTITATYTSELRQYTITYVSKNVTLQTSTGLYGENIPYTGNIPTYTLEESAYSYYLFTGWDKSGIIDGDKVVNAIFDSCTYRDGYFADKDLSELRPVEIYAMMKLGLESTYADSKDAITMSFGNDYVYDDIESVEVISEKTVFDGTNYVDTGITLFDEDRDFVLAVDYKMASITPALSVLAQCFQFNGSNGFKLWNNSGSKITWGTTSQAIGELDGRDMIVLRHIKGEQGFHVYHSDLGSAGSEEYYVELARTKDTVGTSTLVFGCEKADDGAYENFAVGEIHWAKIWYADIGETACKELAVWTHEELTLEMAGFKNYYLSDNSGQRCSMTFVAAHLLDRNMPLTASSVSSNSGGWATTVLNAFMNDRMYRAITPEWRQLIQQVKVGSSAGNKSTEITYSDCYLTIPALIEIDASRTSDPYVFEGTHIPYVTTTDTRIRSYVDGEAATYWTRSPNVSYTTYFFSCEEDGEMYGHNYPYNKKGILVELSI